jgi:hypothetical protein
MRNEEGPSLPAFEHLRVGVQDPQPYRWPATPGRIFSLEESIIPNRESEGDFPAFRLRPLKGEDEQRASSVQSEKRRRSTDDEDDGKRKTKVPRKILVACDFCRGKLTRVCGV